MTASKPTGGRAAGGDVQELRREIDQTRQELGDTVEALARKTDVKARTRQAVTEARERVRDRVPPDAGPVLLSTVLAGVGLVTILAITWWRRRRA